MTDTPFCLTLMTSDAAHAAAADAAGVNRIGVDLEVLGKIERQQSRPSWIAGHTCDDLRRIGGALRHAELFARIHPFALGGRDELEQVLEAGARVVMLPMFRSAAQALEFVQAVGPRARPVLLLETVEAANDLPALLRSSDEFEIHIGLNDLGISRGHSSPFAMLVDPLLAQIAGQVRASGRALAIGRLARPFHPGMPVEADLVVALTVILGAQGSFLSQYFLRDGHPEDAAWMSQAVATLRERIAYWAGESAAAQEGALARLREQVAATATSRT